MYTNPLPTRSVSQDDDRGLDIILNHTPEAFLLADLNGIILAFNKKAEQHILENMHGNAKKGACVYEFMPATRKMEFQQLLARVALGETIRYQRAYDHADGRKVWFEFLLTPVIENKKVSAVCIKGSDITAVKEAQILSNTLFNDGPVPMFVCEKKTFRYLQVNDAAVHHYHYSRQEFLTMTAFDIRVQNEHHTLIDIRHRGSAIWNHNIIGSHRKKNGELIFVQVALHDIEYMGLEAILVVVTDVTHFVQLQKELNKEKVNKQKSITRAAIRAQEKERSMIGCELHDNVNQMLASVKLFLNHALRNPDEKAHLLEKSIDTVQQSIDEIRHLSHQLLPPLLAEQGLEAAIIELADMMGFSDKVFDSSGLEIFSEIMLCDELKLCIYRIFQEQFSNIVKYAMASQIVVKVQKENEMLQMQIIDNGVGFDTKAVRKGIGLSNICNRAALFEGKMKINSAKGKGTCMTVIFRLQENGMSKCA